VTWADMNMSLVLVVVTLVAWLLLFKHSCCEQLDSNDLVLVHMLGMWLQAHGMFACSSRILFHSLLTRAG